MSDTTKTYEITVGDVLHRLIHNAPWNEGDRLDAIAVVTKEFGHPTPRPTVEAVANQLHEENASLKKQIEESNKRVKDLEDAMIRAGIIAAKPAAQSVNPLKPNPEVSRLEAENAALRAQITNQPADAAAQGAAAQKAADEAAAQQGV